MGFANVCSGTVSIVRDAGSLDQFREDSSTGARMDEGDAPVMQANPWLTVDQLNSCIRQRIERPGQVIDEVRDVVKARSARCQEAAYPGVTLDRRENLDPRLTDPQRRDIYVLLDNTRLSAAREAELPVLLDRQLDVLDDDADVMDRSGRGEGALTHRFYSCLSLRFQRGQHP